MTTNPLLKDDPSTPFNIECCTTNFMSYIASVERFLGKPKPPTPFSIRFIGTPDESPGLSLKIETIFVPGAPEYRIVHFNAKGEPRRLSAAPEQLIKTLRDLCADIRANAVPPTKPSASDSNAGATPVAPNKPAKVGDTLSFGF